MTRTDQPAHLPEQAKFAPRIRAWLLIALLIPVLGLIWLAIRFSGRDNIGSQTPRLSWEFGSNQQWLDWNGVDSPDRTNDLTLLRRYPDAIGLDLGFSRVDGGNYSEIRGLHHLEVLVASCDASDDDCLPISQCSQLERLSLEYTQVTDAGLARIAQLNRLKYLTLPSAATDFAIQQFATARLPLQSLSLSATRIGDSGAAYLAAFPQLTYLNISRTRITDDGFRAIGSLKQLTVLHADDLTLTDRCCSMLRRLPCLRKLSLRNAAISDRGVEQLAHLPKLEMLYLGGTKVTDRGLKSLARLPHILKVGYSSQMSPAAIKNFEEQHPCPPNL
ncbi:MAG: hypothetical protein KDA90_18025 [Planctomycetaceae bacterium]|nr:hypothetical protein [Planctomycetaceae bacterium]